jgi:Zn-dependent peptidase ImmA (M78 family)
METLRIAGRRYSDPDIISLARESGELIDPRFAILSKVRVLLGKLDGFPGVPGDPLERLKILASLNGIKIQPMDMDQQRRYKRDAAVFPTSSGWMILYNPNRPKGRTLFTLAHEIVHTLFPNSISGARFRSITNPDSRESNELERLCDLGAAELVMPMDEFQQRANDKYDLAAVDGLAAQFGTSFEATVFRLASAHPGLAVAGLLRYRLRLEEERKARSAFAQTLLFSSRAIEQPEPAEKKYRRQSLHLSARCGDEYLIPWNKSFDPSSVVYDAGAGGIRRAIERLPNLTGKCGRIEATLCPFQREESDKDFGDVLFFWEEFS